MYRLAGGFGFEEGNALAFRIGRGGEWKYFRLEISWVQWFLLWYLFSILKCWPTNLYVDKILF